MPHATSAVGAADTVGATWSVMLLLALILGSPVGVPATALSWLAGAFAVSVWAGITMAPAVLARWEPRAWFISHIAVRAQVETDAQHEEGWCEWCCCCCLHALLCPWRRYTTGGRGGATG